MQQSSIISICNLHYEYHAWSVDQYFLKERNYRTSQETNTWEVLSYNIIVTDNFPKIWWKGVIYAAVYLKPNHIFPYCSILALKNY